MALHSHRRPLAFAALLLAAGCTRPTDLSQPVAGPDEATATRSAAVTTGNVLANDRDPAGGALTIASFTQGALGTVTSHGDGTFTWDPLASIGSGDDQFTYTVQNPQGITATGVVTVHVAPSWSRPSTLSATAASNFKVASDALGNVTVIVSGDASGNGLVAYHRDPAFRWSGPTPLLVGPPQGVTDFQVFADAAGNAAVVWVQDNIWAASYRAATGTWGTSAPLDPHGAVSLVTPAAAMDGAGNLTVAWPDAAQGHVYAARLEAASGGWGPATPIDSGTAPCPAANLSLAVDRAGNVTAVWSQCDVAGSSAWGSRLPVTTGVWGTPTMIGPDRSASTSAAMLLPAGQGVAYALVLQDNAAGPRLWATRFDGAAWGTPALLTSGSFQAMASADEDGNAVVVWTQVDAGTGANQLWANAYPVPVGGWSGPSRLDGGTAGPGVSFAKLKADADGNVVVVWSQSNGTEDRAFAARLPRMSSSWSVRQLSTEAGRAGCGIALEIRDLYVDASGNATLLWSQCDGTLQHAWAAHYDRGSGLWTPSGKIEQNEQHTLANLRSAMDATGAITVSLRLQEGGTVDRVSAVRMSPSGVWEAPFPLGSSTLESNTPRLFSTGGGEITAVWPSRSDPNAADLWVAHWAGGAWQAPQRLIPPGEWTDCWQGYPGPGLAMTLVCQNGPFPYWTVDWR